jgi:hypothetical protein
MENRDKESDGVVEDGREEREREHAMSPAVINNGEISKRKSRSDSKRTPQRLAAICRLVQQGLTVTHAAAKIRVHHSTVAQWRKDLPDFDEAISAAEAAFIAEQTRNIRTAGKKNWQASAWLLERKWPQYFSQPQIQLNMGHNKPQFEELRDVVDRIKKDPKMMKTMEEIRTLGVHKWMALHNVKMEQLQEKVIEGREVVVDVDSPQVTNGGTPAAD